MKPVQYINDGQPFPPSKQPYHLRRRNYLYSHPFDEETHYIQVEVDGVVYPREDTDFHASVMILNGEQPKINSVVKLTPVEKPEDELLTPTEL